MDKIGRKIYAIIALVPLIAACDDNVVSVDNPGRAIEIAAGFSDETKALLNNGGLGDNSAITLYDVLGDDGHTPYLNGLTATKTDGAWSIAGAPPEGYSWLYNEKLYDHNFFGWLINDYEGLNYQNVFMNGSTPVVPTVADNHDGVVTWSVGSVPMRFNYGQFDFCFSNIVSRKVEKPDYSRVNLHLIHLFTAIGISFHNYDSAPVTIKSIKIFGLTNVKSASVEFNTNTGVVTPSYVPDPGQSRDDLEHALELLATPITVQADGDIKNVITTAYTGGKSQDEEAFFLMWPQTADELENCTLAVKLEGMDEYATLSLKPGNAPDNYGWDTGTKHHIELAARGKNLDLKVAPIPWDQQQMQIDGEEGITCNDAFKLKFEGTSCTIDSDSERIYFVGGKPIKLSFKLETPQNATWMVKMEGDIDAFEIDNAGVDGKEVNYGDGINTPSGPIDTNMAWVTIYPRNLDPDQDYKIKISIVVRTATGRLLVDDKVLGIYKDYTIVQQAS